MRRECCARIFGSCGRARFGHACSCGAWYHLVGRKEEMMLRMFAPERRPEMNPLMQVPYKSVFEKLVALDKIRFCHHVIG